MEILTAYIYFRFLRLLHHHLNELPLFLHTGLAYSCGIIDFRFACPIVCMHKKNIYIFLVTLHVGQVAFLSKWAVHHCQNKAQSIQIKFSALTRWLNGIKIPSKINKEKVLIIQNYSIQITFLDIHIKFNMKLKFTLSIYFLNACYWWYMLYLTQIVTHLT